MDAGCHTCLTLFLPDAEGSQGKRPNTHQSQPLSNILLAPAVTSNIHLVAPDAGKNAYAHRNGVAKPTDLQWVQVDFKRKGEGGKGQIRSGTIPESLRRIKMCCSICLARLSLSLDSKILNLAHSQNAAEHDAVRKCQRAPCNLRYFLLNDNKAKWRRMDVTLGEVRKQTSERCRKENKFIWQCQPAPGWHWKEANKKNLKKRCKSLAADPDA